MLLPEARYVLNQLKHKAAAQAAMRPAAALEQATKSAFQQSKDLDCWKVKREGFATPLQARIEVGTGGVYDVLRKFTGKELGREFVGNLIGFRAIGLSGEAEEVLQQGILKRITEEGMLSPHPTDPTKVIIKDPTELISTQYKNLSERERQSIREYTKLSEEDYKSWMKAHSLAKEKVFKEQALIQQYGSVGYRLQQAKEAKYNKMFPYEMRELEREQKPKDAIIEHLTTQAHQHQNIHKYSLKLNYNPTEQNPIRTNKKRIQHQVRDQRTKQGHLFQGPGGSIL